MDIETGNGVIQNASFIGQYSSGLFRYNIGGKFDLKGKRTRGGKWGYISPKGEITIPAIYDFCTRFSDERAIVRLYGKYGIINQNGDIVLPIEFDKLLSSWDSLMRCKLLKDDKEFTIDKYGNIVDVKPYVEDEDDSCIYNNYLSDYSDSELHDMYIGAFEGDSSAQWNVW